ncbi:MAG: Cable pili-associated 22 kDa adhesin protein, partial [Frankiales bacterium]|nr:Cable pili-associated 22 kDa adhesin protein [Frankiales bacterium]
MGGETRQPGSQAAHGRRRPRALRSRIAQRLGVLAVVVGVVVPLASAASAARGVPLADPVIAAAQPALGTVEQPVWTVVSPYAMRCTFGEAGHAVPDPVPCADTFTGVTTGDGTWVLSVQAVDGADSSAPVSTTYVRDSTLAVSVLSPLTPSQDRTPSWTVGLAPGATATCALTGAAPEPCAGEWTSPTVLTDGEHVLTVAVTGASGRTARVLSSAYELDTSPPPTPVVTGMPVAGQADSARWTWSEASGERATCELARDGVVVASPSCAPGRPLALAADGSWTLRVTLVDAAGNQSGSGESEGYLRDTAAPDPPAVTQEPPAIGSDPAPVWSVQPGAGAVECRLLVGSTGPGDWFAAVGNACIADLTAGQPEGPVAMQLRSRDAAGNVSPTVEGSTYLFDRTPPALPVVVAHPASGSGGPVTFDVVVTPGVTAECLLSRPDGLPAGGGTGFAPCPTTTTVFLGSADPEGRYVLEARAADAAGNVSTGFGSFLLDRTVPTAPLVTGPRAGDGRRATFHVKHEEGATARCSLLRPDGAADPDVPCDVSYALPEGLPDGGYVLRVVTVDQAGNTSVPYDLPYAVDRVPPAPVDLLSEPSGAETGAGWTWTWRVEPGASVVCGLVGPAGDVPVSCDPSGLTVPTGALPGGSYRLQVATVDAAGHRSPLVERSYVLDRQLPVLTVTASRSGRTLSWTIETDGDLDTLSCELTAPDGSQDRVWSCPSTLRTQVPAGADGVYRLAVTVSGHGGQQRAEGSYLWDGSGPVLSTAPSAGPSAADPAWSVTSSEPVRPATGADCRVVGPLPLAGPVPEPAPETSCSWAGDVVTSAVGGPLHLGSDGRYLLLIQARDLAGNLTASTEGSPVRTWTVDREPPAAATLVQPTPPVLGRERTVAWTWDRPDAATVTTCLLRSPGSTGVVVPCSSEGYTAELAADGPYDLEVTRTDEAGNATSAEFDYTLDTAPPAVPVLTPGSPSTGRERQVSWAFPSPEKGTTAVCSLTSPTAAPDDLALVSEPEPIPCGDGRVSRVLTGPDGTYVLLVAFVDAADNHGGSAEARYTLDTTAPEAPTLAGGPGETGSAARVEWTFDAEVGALTSCQLLRVGSAPPAETPCTSPYTRNLRGGQGSYQLRVRATDQAGNRSDPVTSAPYRLVARGGPSGVTWLETPGHDPAGLPGQNSQYAQVNGPFLFTAPEGALCELHRGPSLGEIDPTPVAGPAPCVTDPDGQASYLVADPVAEDSYAYELVVSVVLDGDLVSVGRRAFVLDTADPEAPAIVSGTGSGGTARNTWTWTSTEPGLTAL